MGLGNNMSSGTTYLTVGFGKICKRVKEPTKTSIVRKLTMGPNEGQEINEEQYTSLDGYIRDVKVKETSFGFQWLIDIEDGEDSYQMQIPYESGTARGILNRLPNIDLKSPVTINSMEVETKKGGTKTVLWMLQNGVKIPSAYTQEDPNGMPEVVKKMKGRKEEYDFGDQLLFLEKMIEGLPFNRLPGPDKKSTSNSANTMMGGDEPDDLPF